MKREWRVRAWKVVAGMAVLCALLVAWWGWRSAGLALMQLGTLIC